MHPLKIVREIHRWFLYYRHDDYIDLRHLVELRKEWWIRECE